MNCLRCGREISDDLTFCDECRKTVSQPLKESPYLNTQIILPTRQKNIKAVQTKSGKKPDRKNEKAEPKTHRALTGFLAVLCILVLAFALVVSMFYLDLRNERIEVLSKADAVAQHSGFLTERIEFVNKSVVLIESDGEKYYHCIDCPSIDLEKCEVLRLTTVQMRGYKPCPDCH